VEGVDALLAAVREKAWAYKDTLMVGRTHGIHAEPITFGLKMAVWHQELTRNRVRLLQAREAVAVGKLSGAVGTYATIPPEVESYVCERLGLKPAAVSTQIIQRDRHAQFFTALAILASSLEKFALEIRHLQRSEVREAEEPFGAGQKGSSAMPHKRNPVLTENICGLARLVRSYAMASLENIPLWHERDISHSSAERVIAPDGTILMDFMLHRLCSVLRRLQVHPERMKENLMLTRGLLFSQGLLLRLVDKGMSREEAYRIVQGHAMQVWEGEGDLRSRVRQDPRVMALLDPSELDEVFRWDRYLRHVDTIFARVFGADPTTTT
jgi:adenylosuccinate lyase